VQSYPLLQQISMTLDFWDTLSQEEATGILTYYENPSLKHWFQNITDCDKNAEPFICVSSSILISAFFLFCVIH
jgi:hypothetical protein